MFGLQARRIRYQLLLVGITSLLLTVTACSSGSSPHSPEQNPIQTSKQALSPTQTAVNLIFVDKTNGTGHCDTIWKLFINAPTPRNWIALLSVINMGTIIMGKCEHVIRPKITEALTESARSNAQVKRNAILRMTTFELDPSILSKLLSDFPEILRGEFFHEATLSQQAILQAYFCRKIGTLLAGVELRSRFNEKVEFNGTYADKCKDRELRRRFISWQGSGS